MKGINGALALAIASLIYFCWCRLISKSKKEEKIHSIIDKMPNEYK